MNAAADEIKRLLQAGLTHQRAGQLRQAEAAYRQVLARSPNEPNATHYLALIALRTGHDNQAVRMLESVVRAHPHVVEWRKAYAHALQQNGRVDDAINQYLRSLQTKPDDEAAASAVAGLLAMRGRFEEAEGVCREVLEKRPGASRLVGNLAVSMEHSGRHEEAVAALEPRLKESPVDPMVAYAFGRVAHRFDRAEEAVRLLRGRLEIADLDPAMRAHLLFTLGDRLRGLQEIDGAFRAYADGNKALGTQWRPDLHTQYVDAIMDAYSASAFESLSTSRVTDETPLFIVGMPRSGTSLVEQIIASHPSAYGAGELPDIRRYSKADIPEACGATGRYPHYADALNADGLTRVATRHLARLRREGGDAIRVTDKLPSNDLLLGLIAQLFPKARVIWCRRRSVDTCVSCFIHNFTFGNPYTRDLDHLGRYSVDHRRLMAHWQDALPLPILEMPYEELVSEPRPWIERLIDFCGLPWDERCMRSHESERYVGTASYDQVRQPIHAGAINKYEAFEPFLGPLHAALGEPADQ